MSIDFSVGHWAVDLRARELRSGSRTVRLEKKALGVLAEIARAAPEPITSEELMRRVWPGVVVGDGALYRVVAMLRKELGDDSRNPRFIESIPRSGYRLLAPVTFAEDAGPGSNGPSRHGALPLGRIPILTEFGSRRGRAMAPCFAAEIGRYLGWSGTAFQVLRRPEDAPSASHYSLVVDIEPRDGEVAVAWELLRGGLGELVWSSEHVESADRFRTTRQRIAELIADGVVRAVRRQRSVTWDRDPQSPDLSYWDLVLLGDRYQSMETDHLRARRALLQRAIVQRPDQAPAYAACADFLSWTVANGVSGDPRQTLRDLCAHARTAMDLDPQDPYVLARCGAAYSRIGFHSEGVELCRRAAAMAPSTWIREVLATALCFAGMPEEAITLYHRIIRTMPSGHVFQYGKIVVALTQCGQLHEALEYAERAVIHFPKDYFCWAMLSNLRAQLGDIDGGRAAFAQAREYMPDLTVDSLIDGTRRTYGRTRAQRQWLSRGLACLGG